MAVLEKEGKQVDLHNLSGKILKQIRYNRTMISTSEDIWDIYGDNSSQYERTFARVLEDETILNFIKQKRSPIIIDIMGPSFALRDFFQEVPDKSKLGIALSLLDKRTVEEKNKDQKSGIKQFAGNIMRRGFWRGIKAELGERKADLIMERAMGGLDCLPKDEHMYSMLLSKAWNLLNEQNGMLLFQVTSYVDLKENSVRIEEWINLLKVNNLNVKYHSNKYGNTDAFCRVDRGVIKIIKTPDSLKELPFLR